MYKFLFPIFLFLYFIFPIKDAFAQACTVQSSCQNPAWEVKIKSTGNKCGPKTGTQPNSPPNPIQVINSASCPSGMSPNSTATDGSCNCVDSTSPEAVTVPAAGAGAAAVVDPCADPKSINCTKGGGQRCTPGATTDTNVGPGIKTAIGCIPTEPQALVEGLLKFGTLAAGGIAFLLMILGALGMITAEGNPEAIKHAQEMFYSAIIGLLLIIFSVLLMQVIGVDVLGLPGFGKN